MPDIHIVRPHELGLDGARHLVSQWISDAEREYGMHCTVQDDGQTVDFQRAGVRGQLKITPECIELSAELGFLYKSFGKKISSAIKEKVDKLLKKA